MDSNNEDEEIMFYMINLPIYCLSFREMVILRFMKSLKLHFNLE